MTKEKKDIANKNILIINEIKKTFNFFLRQGQENDKMYKPFPCILQEMRENSQLERNKEMANWMFLYACNGTQSGIEMIAHLVL